MKKLTKKEKIELNTQLKSLVKAYLTARAYNEEILKAEKRIKNYVLQKCGKFYLMTGKEYVDDEDRICYLKEKKTIKEENGKHRILDCSIDYLLADEDSKKYRDIVHIERQKEGYNLETIANCTFDYESRKLLKIGEDALLQFQIDFTEKANDNKGLTTKDLQKMHTHWKYRDKCLDMMCRLDIR